MEVITAAPPVSYFLEPLLFSHSIWGCWSPCFGQEEDLSSRDRWNPVSWDFCREMDKAREQPPWDQREGAGSNGSCLGPSGALRLPRGPALEPRTRKGCVPARDSLTRQGSPVGQVPTPVCGRTPAQTLSHPPAEGGLPRGERGGELPGKAGYMLAGQAVRESESVETAKLSEKGP